MGGCGLGLGYVSPVGTLIRWFPDRRGLAAGFAVGGFGFVLCLVECDQHTPQCIF
jgi:hypothetical protein